MDKRQPPKLPGRNRDVRNLEGHPNDKGKIGKVKIVGLFFLREFQPLPLLILTAPMAFRGPVIKVRIP